jgi:hypothetical protein
VDECNETLCYNVLLFSIILITLYIVFADSFWHASRQLFGTRPHHPAAAHLPHRSLHIPDSKETDEKLEGEQWPCERDFLPLEWKGTLLYTRMPRALFKCLCRW